MFICRDQVQCIWRCLITCRSFVFMCSTLNTLVFHIYNPYPQFTENNLQMFSVFPCTHKAFIGWGSWRLSVHLYISFFTPLIQHVYSGTLFRFIYRIRHMNKMIFWWMNLEIIYFIYSNSFIQIPTIMHITLPV